MFGDESSFLSCCSKFNVPGSRSILDDFGLWTLYFGLASGRSYFGASSVNARTGRSAFNSPLWMIRSRSPSTTFPITTASRSHLLKISTNSFSRPFRATISILSCDSESIISYAVIPVSRCGTSVRSSSRPVPARAAISTDDEVNPAAPMSWIPAIAPDRIASRQASRSSFSKNGSPT